MKGTIAALTVVVGLAFGSVACSHDKGSSSAPSAKAPAASSDAKAAKGGDTGALPSGFPMPSDVYSLQSATLGARVSATMRIKQPAADYTFWTTELPKAGYTITENTPLPTGGLLYFNGNGYKNGSVAVNDVAVAIALVK